MRQDFLGMVIGSISQTALSGTPQPMIFFQLLEKSTGISPGTVL